MSLFDDVLNNTLDSFDNVTDTLWDIVDEQVVEPIVDVINAPFDWAAEQIGGLFEEYVFEPLEDLSEWYNEEVVDPITNAFETSGCDGGDITDFVDYSAYTDTAFEFWGAVGQIDSSDTYTFTLDTAQNFYAELTELNADVDMYLYDSYGYQIGSSTSSSVTEELISSTLEAGNYSLEIRSYDSLTTGYTLTVDSALA